MDGVSRAAGVGPTITLGGRTWTVRGRTVEFYALLEAEIIRQRGDPFKLLAESARTLRDEKGAVDRVSLDALASSIAAHFRSWNSATYADYAQFWNTPAGDAFRIWAAIRQEDKDLSPQQVLFWLMEMLTNEGEGGAKKRDEWLDAIDQATGIGTLGN